MKRIGKRPLTIAERAQRRRAKRRREGRVFIEIDLARKTLAIIDDACEEGERRGLAADRLIQRRSPKTT